LRRVRLGKSGVRISQLGFGTYQATSIWGGDDSEVIGALREACRMSANLIDTAEEYGSGHSEEVVGRAIRKIGRDNVVVATKVYGAHLRYEELQKACAASLRRLGVREIDLYQVHWPDPWEQIPLKHTMKAMEKLHREGKIRAIGVSNFAKRDLEEGMALLPRSEIVSDQVRYNLVQREIEEEVLPFCRRNGIAILAWGPLGQGVLSGRYSSRSLPTNRARSANPLFWKHNIRQIEKLIRELRRVASSRGKTVSQVALNWLMKDRMVVPIVGARTPAQAQENIGATGWTLTPGELRQIEDACSRLKLDYFAR
jgi:myo-inositol catabolism protein IolS